MKKAIIVGWGKSGQGSAKLLQSHGYEVSIYDDNKVINCQPYENISSKDLTQCIQNSQLVVLSPSVELNHPLVECAKLYGVEVVGEIELGYRYCNSPIVAITGTNGKTTTTMLMRDIIHKSGRNAKALGNIGESFCGELADKSNDDVIVLEVSSFQLESIISFRSKYAILLNISPDHLERHVSMSNYVATKKRIFVNQKNNDFAILNYDDDTARQMISDVASVTYYFSCKQRVKGAYLFENKLMFEDIANGVEAQVICRVEDLWSHANYNISNALACIVVAKLMKISNEQIVCALKNFAPPRYRMEYFGKVLGKKIFNDSKATNIDSTLKACESMQGSTALIVGGYNKGIAYHSFFAMLPKNITSIIACGENAREIMEFMPDYHEYSWEITATLERAVQLAFEKSTDNILFSPTTSSFDRYNSYVQRGEHFDSIVKGYVEGYVDEAV